MQQTKKSRVDDMSPDTYVGLTHFVRTGSGRTLHVDGGRIADVLPDSFGIRAFKGIPYAAPPIGELRWKTPQPVPKWNGVRYADAWGPRCIQDDFLGDLDPQNDRADEDCLYLNVWTPATSQDEKLAVVVWIHGGGNRNGAGSQPEYDGRLLSQKGILVVTINYRLDIFGFLAHPELTRESGKGASGNYGLLDQIAALRWVQTNIAKFGGDPSRVTIAGQSAGAFNISLLMVSPLAKGLFASAIGESGGAATATGPFGYMSLDMREQEGVRFSTLAKAESVAELRAMPANVLLDIASNNPAAYVFGTIDGYVVPEEPFNAYNKGMQSDVPLLIGWNEDEGSLFTVWFAPPADHVEHEKRIRNQFQDLADAALNFYPIGSTPEEYLASYIALLGDQICCYGGWAWSQRAALRGKSPVYRYHFKRRPPGAPAFSICPMAAPGVYHFAEVYYVFRNLRSDWHWESGDLRLSDSISSYWANFAKFGNPNGDSLPHWPTYDPRGGGYVMNLGDEIGAGPEQGRSRFEFLDSVSRKAATG